MKAPFVGRGLLAVAFFAAWATGANALVFRAYLSSTGNDANPCTLPAPCRLLPAALAAVANGGEIWMLDSANYNTSTVTITKSVTILAVPGALGGVVATGGPGIRGNPTLYLEYTSNSGEPDELEGKLLLGDTLAPGWHWGVNLSVEQQLRGARATETMITGGISYSLIDTIVDVGVETRLARTNVA